MTTGLQNEEALLKRMRPVASLLNAGLVLFDTSGNPLATTLSLGAPVPPVFEPLVTCPVSSSKDSKSVALLALTALDAAAKVRIGTHRSQCQVWLRQLAADLAPLLTPFPAGHVSPITLTDLYGIDARFAEVRELASRVAPTDSSVLIRGESGTGKELFARAIHAESHLRNGPFVVINCAAIPEHLLESELFGYEEGAFTGARRGGKPGRLELAAGGTLFLDEVGDLPMYLQAKLLRVLQFREVERVGGIRTIQLDFRLITATNRPLEDLVSQNLFREDLFYRLNVISLTIPPLRERKDDLVMLLELFTKRYYLRLNVEPKRWSAEALGAVLRYRWPGNVRELQNVVERVVVLHQGDLITLESLPRELSASGPQPAVETSSPLLPVRDAEPKLKGSVRGAGPTPEEIRAVISRNSNTAAGRDAAARELGISRATLYRRLRQLRLR